MDGTFFLVLKWWHIISIICWMAGILYLYRLLVYHSENRASAEIHKLLIVMERRLLNGITMPGMVSAVITGLTMIYLNPGYFKQGSWMHTKLTFVFFLLISTFYARSLVLKFRDQANPVPTSKSLRFLNEVPTILMMIIVALVVFRF